MIPKKGFDTLEFKNNRNNYDRKKKFTIAETSNQDNGDVSKVKRAKINLMNDTRDLTRTNKESSYADKSSDEDSDIEDNEELKISRENIDFNLPKPGPHAKPIEWRKWKNMQRAIRQIREEKRILKREKAAKELEESKKRDGERTNALGRSYTLSIAVPGSIFNKIQARELKTYVAGQIARAAVLFCVDEIIVYDDLGIKNEKNNENMQQLMKVMEYLECPQYLRKTLFPPHKYLEHVGLLSPLEALHHYKVNDEWTYREGVTTDIPTKEGQGSYVDIGLINKIQVDKKIQAGIRVTVKRTNLANSNKLKGIIVSPEAPRIEAGLYWGYMVRFADSFRKVLYESSFNKEKYDLKIAVSNTNKMSFDHLKNLPQAKHILVMFSGKDGIEAAIEADDKLKASKLEQIFNYNCLLQDSNRTEQMFGSRTIRLEEAVLISLSLLKPIILSTYTAKENHESTLNSKSDDDQSQEETNESEKENQSDNDDDDDDNDNDVDDDDEKEQEQDEDEDFE